MRRSGEEYSRKFFFLRRAICKKIKIRKGVFCVCYTSPTNDLNILHPRMYTYVLCSNIMLVYVCFISFSTVCTVSKRNISDNNFSAEKKNVSLLRINLVNMTLRWSKSNVCSMLPAIQLYIYKA